MTTPATLQTFHPQPSPNAEKLELLRQHFPGAIDTDAQGRMRINANALQLAIDPRVAVEEDGYELRWVGKREAYHSAFVPPQKILQPLLADSQDWDATDNLLIKGDNLDALRLLRQNYFGQVKLIYIDPPYNTQSDAFIYRDDFSARQSEVLEQLGYNADTIDYVKNIYGARTHSGWLSFMYPRLLLAKDLLRDDGVIFISIDDNEQAQLKLLCDEVFGEENFVDTVIWEKRYSPQNAVQWFSEVHDYVLVYAKQKENWQPHLLKRTDEMNARYRNLDNDSRGDWKPVDATAQGGHGTESQFYTLTAPNGKKHNPPSGRCWLYTHDVMQKMIADNRVWFGATGNNMPAIKRFITEVKQGIACKTIWKYDEVGHNQEAKKEIKEIFDDVALFDTPKPKRLINRILQIGTDSQSIILDFFSGSGTTAQAVMELNAEDGGQRRFILVQIPQPIDAKKQKEAYTFVTQTLGKSEATIFEITAERIRRAGAKIKAQHPDVDTGFRVFDLVDDPDGLILQKPLHAATQEDFAALQQTITTPQPDQVPRVLFNLLLAEGLPLSEKIQEIRPLGLYSAGNTLFILQAVDVLLLRQAWEAAQAAGQPLSHISIYAPWVQDDNFLLGVNSWLDTLDLAADRLHLRG